MQARWMCYHYVPFCKAKGWLVTDTQSSFWMLQTTFSARPD